MDDRRLVEGRCPAALGPLLRRSRDAYGFNFCYTAKLAREAPFETTDGAWLLDILRATPRAVCFLRDASAAVPHVQHGSAERRGGEAG